MIHCTDHSRTSHLRTQKNITIYKSRWPIQQYTVDYFPSSRHLADSQIEAQCLSPKHYPRSEPFEVHWFSLYNIFVHFVYFFHFLGPTVPTVYTCGRPNQISLINDSAKNVHIDLPCRSHLVATELCMLSSVSCSVFIAANKQRPITNTPREDNELWPQESLAYCTLQYTTVAGRISEAKTLPPVHTATTLMRQQSTWCYIIIIITTN